MNINPAENMQLALRQVWTHRFRSALTILGIVIGITTVVTVASLLTGLRAGMVTFFDSLGPDNIFVSKNSGNPGDLQEPIKERKRRPMDPAYADAIRRVSSTVEDISLSLFIPPAINGAVITAKVPGLDTDTLSIVGVFANSITITPRGFD